MAPKLAATAPGSDRLKRQLFIYAAPKQTVRSRPRTSWKTKLIRMSGSHPIAAI